MVKFPKRIIIIGGGASIRQGEWDKPIKDLPLWDILKKEYTIGTNFNYKWLIPTVHMFVDYHFYMIEQSKLSQLPLIVGRKEPHLGVKKNSDGSLVCEVSTNTYLLPTVSQYTGEKAWINGFYKGTLVGIFALNFAIACGFQEIYLLGFDACSVDGRTHFYQGDKENTGTLMKEGKPFTGVGWKIHSATKKREYKTSVYNSSIDNHFKAFKPELDKIKIINVSPNSKINVFPKIDYREFYARLEADRRMILQSSARQEIEEIILKRLKP